MDVRNFIFAVGRIYSGDFDSAQVALNCMGVGDASKCGNFNGGLVGQFDEIWDPEIQQLVTDHVGLEMASSIEVLLHMIIADKVSFPVEMRTLFVQLLAIAKNYVVESGDLVVGIARFMEEFAGKMQTMVQSPEIRSKIQNFLASLDGQMKFYGISA
jgi:hypothetical protein